MGLFSAFGLAASAGLNAYIPLLITGVIAHYTDWIVLSPPWDTLANPWVLIVLGLLVIVEMLADKVPAVNHINDAIQTFIRPTAGAILFAASTRVITGLHPVLAIICGLLVAGTVHGVKSLLIRPMVTVTTAGMGNTPVSLIEDVTATVITILAWLLPVLMLLVVGVLLLWWLHWRRHKILSRR
ncbi:MAG: DUF4126 domain-containing protein [Anaerolineales bacterium]